jgi:ATPase subunit of ABC transporter with duplicated ATPase domains
LFADLSLDLRRHCMSIIGPNGSGKTTLLQIILQERFPEAGNVVTDHVKIGAIAQGGTDWMLEESLILFLLMTTENLTLEKIECLLDRCKFPVALADRPLKSLSPGERVRAALICLFSKSPVVEVLVLDEPTYCLDFEANKALCEGLKAWSGGLIVASHDEAFLAQIGINCRLAFDGSGNHALTSASHD